MTTLSPYALNISHIKKDFGKTTAVDGVSFTVKQGEIFGLLGPNGAGKSTLINLISGVCKMQTGNISVLGFDNAQDFRITRKLIGVMHQEIITDPFFDIDRALKIHSGYYGCKDDPQWRELLIDRLALKPHLTKTMQKLSGGMKRRFMVAKALIHKPKILILDEPTAGVDVELRKNLWEFVKEINKTGTTIVLTTHYLQEADEMCDRIAIMDKGHLIALDTKENLKKTLEQKTLKITTLHNGRQHTNTHLIKNNNEINDIICGYQQQSKPIYDIETTSPNLEDVFLHLTSKGSQTL
jgi:ABC-2 type transport system ATP-binding protein